ncbi:unnamed protein product [Sympodiomycopsis kandeliae]
MGPRLQDRHEDDSISRAYHGSESQSQSVNSSYVSFQRRSSENRDVNHHHRSGGRISSQAAAAAKEKQTKRRRADYLTGIGLLLLVVLLWTGSNFLTNNLLTSGWDKPFAVTYANTSSFALYLIPFALAWQSKRKEHRHHRGNVRRNTQSEASTPEGFWTKFGFSLPEIAEVPGSNVNSSGAAQARRGSYTALATNEARSRSYDSTRLRPVSPEREFSSRPSRLLHQHSRPSSIDGRRPASLLRGEDREASEIQLPSGTALPPLTFRETAILAAQFTLVWFAANWSLNAGLGMTSVASGTTLSSASGFFTLALGSLTGVEQFTRTKFLAVVISFIGVVLVTHADSSNPDVGPGDSTPSNAPLGDFLSLLSAFFYAVYVTLLKLRIKSEDRVSMPLFFGFVGAFNILGMWPVGIGLDLTGVEKFAWPVDTRTWVGVGVNMLITFISDFSYLLSMLKTAPLIATVGLSLTIPLAVFIDLLKGTHSGGWMANIGSAAVLFSFVAVGLDDNQEIEDDQTQQLDAEDVERDAEDYNGSSGYRDRERD